MAVRAEEIASILREQIEGFGTSVAATDVGTVIEAGDGIARIHGLSGACTPSWSSSRTASMGLALNLEEETVGVVVLGDYTDIKEGDEVRTTGPHHRSAGRRRAARPRGRRARQPDRRQGPDQHHAARARSSASPPA